MHALCSPLPCLLCCIVLAHLHLAQQWLSGRAMPRQLHNAWRETCSELMRLRSAKMTVIDLPSLIFLKQGYQAGACVKTKSHKAADACISGLCTPQPHFCSFSMAQSMLKFCPYAISRGYGFVAHLAHGSQIYACWWPTNIFCNI